MEIDSIERAFFLGLAAQAAYPTEREGIDDLGLQQVDTFDFKAVGGFIGSTATDVLLAFRGSKFALTPADTVESWLGAVLDDWGVNLRAAPVSLQAGRVHGGYASALAAAWPRLSLLLEQHGCDEKQLWLTGHSLGGALAQLAGYLAYSDRHWAAEGVFSFGAPKIGDEFFAHNYPVAAFRYEHRNDIFPHLPPSPEFIALASRLPGVNEFLREQFGEETLNTTFTPIGELRFLNWNDQIVDAIPDFQRGFWLIEALLRDPAEWKRHHDLSAYLRALAKRLNA